MIIAKNLESLWNKHKDELIKLYASEKFKPLTHVNLHECYVDKNGKRYYRFHKDDALPVERLGQLNLFYQYLAKALSPSEDEAIDNAIEECVQQGLKNDNYKSAVKISALITERKNRKKITFHSELFFNILALQWIREDESPTKYDSDIQEQKVEQFKLETENTYFFFQAPELIALTGSMKVSPQDAEQLIKESNRELKHFGQRLKTILSYAPTLKSTGTTGTKPS